MVVLAIAPTHRLEIDNQTVAELFAAIIDGFFLSYLLAARRVRDTFSDFPPPLDPPGG
jgi:hypothetical protein